MDPHSKTASGLCFARLMGGNNIGNTSNAAPVMLNTLPVVYFVHIPHTACKDEFRQIFDLTTGVKFHFCNIPPVVYLCPKHTTGDIFVEHASNRHETSKSVLVMPGRSWRPS